MHHILAYNVTAGVNDSNVDMTAAVDPSFSRRNNHYILSEPYNLLAWSHFGASALRARLNVPSINAFARHTTLEVVRSADIDPLHYVDNYMDYPVPLPINEEIAIEETGNLGAATEQEFSLLFVAPPDFNRNVPRGIQRVTARFTATIVVSASAWSADAAITFADNLKGGTYAVVGGMAQAADLLAWRLNFPNMPLYQGRKLYPGYLGNDAIGNAPSPFLSSKQFGEWGRFFTFEAPQISVLSLSGGGTTVEGRLDLIYLGSSENLLRG